MSDDERCERTWEAVTKPDVHWIALGFERLGGIKLLQYVLDSRCPFSRRSPPRAAIGEDAAERVFVQLKALGPKP